MPIVFRLRPSTLSAYCGVPPDEPCRQHGRRIPVGTVAILLALATLRSLAFASPPDPSWVEGIFDGADFDDVVVLVATQAQDIGPTTSVDAAPVGVVVETLRPSSDRPGPACPRTASRTTLPGARSLSLTSSRFEVNTTL